MKTLKETSAIGKQIKDGVKLMGRGAELIKWPIHLEIKKFEDALAKHNTERCSLGPAKGLEESELLALAANEDLCFSYTKKKETVFSVVEVKDPVSTIKELPLSLVSLTRQESSDQALVASG